MSTLQGNPRAAPFLTRHRPRFMRAWLLHTWLILSMLLLPAARLARADGEGGFTLTGTESSVAVNVWAPEGTSGMQQGDTRQVVTYAELNTWEVWTSSDTGQTENRNALTVPITGAGMTFSASGDGSANPSSITTDSSGNGVTTFTMGTGASTVTATVTEYGATGSVTFDEPVITETWTWDHDERLVSASLSTTDSTDNVPNGTTRALQAHADLTTWSVYVSNLGNTRTDNQSTSPAIGATLTWAIESGDGSVSGGSSTDSTGDAAGTFTMAASASVVRLDVSYASSNSTYATLGFNPAAVEETWAYDHTASAVSNLSLSANDTTDSLAPGTQRTVTANVTSTSYEVWTSNLGNTEYRNYTDGPAVGETVSFTLDSGDGSLSAYSATTDSNGNAAVGFTMGSQASHVTASDAGYSAGIDFYPLAETWTYDHSESSLSFSSFTADGSVDDLRPGNTRTLTAEVMSNTWEVWVSNYGNTENRNPSTSPASGVTVGFSVTDGDGQLSTGGNATDGSGHASVTFTMATSSSTVQADVNDGMNGTVTTSITLSLGQPTWTYDHTESTIDTSVTADGSTDSLPVGTTRVVTAHVTFNSYEVWKDDLGNTDNRNYSGGAATNASTYFYVTQGDGSLANVSSSTDSNGNATATYTMGNGAGTVQVDVDYLTAETSIGTIDFSPDPWAYVESKTALILTLVDNGDTSSSVTATVMLRSWDVYTNGTSEEERNVSYSPVINTDVVHNADGDVTFDYDGTTNTTTPTDSSGTATTSYICVPHGSGTITADVSSGDLTDSKWVLVATSKDYPTYAFDYYRQTNGFDPSGDPLTVVQPVTVKWLDTEMTKGAARITAGTTEFTIDPGVATTTNNTAWDISYTTATGLTRIVSEGQVTCKLVVSISVAATDFSATVTQGDPIDSWVAKMGPTLKLMGKVSNVKVREQQGLPDDQSWTEIPADKLISYSYSIFWLNTPNTVEFKFSKEGTGVTVERTMESTTDAAKTVHKTQPQQTD